MSVRDAPHEDFETVPGTPVGPEHGPGDRSVISDTGNAATYGESATYGVDGGEG